MGRPTSTRPWPPAVPLLKTVAAAGYIPSITFHPGTQCTDPHAWEAYIREGVDFALDTVEKATGEKQVNAIGYCVGGTLLAAALALHAQEKNKRIASATLFTLCNGKKQTGSFASC